MAARGLLQLAELNQRSAKLGSWNVSVFHPKTEKYSWTDKTTQESKSGEAFKCLLVSMEDPSWYIQAVVRMRNDNRAPLQKAVAKFTKNKCFCMSQVEFQPHRSQAYVHAPLKLVVNMSATKFDPILNSTNGQVLHAQPAMTLSEIQELQQNQLFDVTALVAQVGESRPAGSMNRNVFDVKLIDGSAIGGKVREVTMSFFHDPQPTQSERAIIEAIKECEKGEQPLSLFALNGKKSERGFTVVNAKECFVVKAAGPRADELQRAAAELHATPDEERELLEQGSFSVRDYKLDEGRQCFCSILKTMTGNTGVQEIDAGETLWQLNYTEVNWPSESEVDKLCTKDGKRLFFSTNIRDGTGIGPDVRMTEESALKLAAVDSKEDFLALHAAGKQQFPPFASIKILRRARKPGSQQLDGINSEQANFIIVHADDQPLNEGPTTATLELFPWMKSASQDSASILPSLLTSVKACAHYAFQVHVSPGTDGGDAVVMPCQKIIGLVKSTKNSTTENLGAGVKLVTKGVEDVLATDAEQSAAAQPATFTLSSTCMLESVTQYRLDPPRGGCTYALVTITAKAGDAFVVEQVQLLANEAAANDAKRSLLQLLFLAKEMCTGGRKRDAPWTDDLSPAKSRKCRSLGRSPTDPPLPHDALGASPKP